MRQEVRNKKRPDREPWFDKKCKKLRNEYIKVKNVYRKFRTIALPNKLTNKSKKFKIYCKHVKSLNEKKLHKNSRKLKNADPKEYWQILSGKKQEHTKINLTLSAAM